MRGVRRLEGTGGKGNCKERELGGEGCRGKCGKKRSCDEG